MKIAICNVPLRSEELKTVYPPLGALAVIQSLRRAGYNANFYDINFFRPSLEELKDYFLRNKFDVVGISATISTSYKYVKNLASIIKSVSPETVIVAGGALTASAEIVLKFTDVDFCVIGEGEKVMVNLVNHTASRGVHKSEEEALKKIKGLCFLDTGGDIVFTGYEKQLAAEEIQDGDYGLIEKYTSIDQYITDPFVYEQFKYDQRSFEEHRKNKRLATVVTSRGCVNRCTFCYRWQRGIRIFPVKRVIKYIENLVEKYNVGFISFGDEDFGTTKKWIEEFIEGIKSLDVLYRISGICSDNADLELLKRLRQSGCVAVHYGFESGSNRILKVMEKRTTAELNEKIAKLTHRAGLQTVPALVVGMPGESRQTVRETIEFMKRITEFLPRDPLISTNALVVLPGTPVYEYARYRGFLGKTLNEEEKYLLRISDQGGSSMKQLNLTDYPYLLVQSWIRYISIETRYNHRKKGAGSPSAVLYSHPLFYYLRYLMAPLLVMYKTYREDKRLFVKRCLELLMRPFKKKTFTNYISLRRFLQENAEYMKNINPASHQILRLGR